MGSVRVAGSAFGVIALLFVAGGCGSDDAGGPDAGMMQGPQRTIAAEVLARHAIGYSGYRGSQSPDTQTYPSEAEIKADLDLLVRGHFTLIRLWDCSTHAERVL